MSDSERPSDDPRDASPRPWGDRLAPVVAVIGSAGVVVSFVYDWGFFFTLGISFSEAPTGLSDHVRGWLIWLPIVVAAALFLLVQELLLSRLERGLSEEEIIASSPNPALTRRFRALPWKVITGLAVVLFFLWLLFGESFASARPLAFFVVWVLFVRWVFGHPRLDADWPALVKHSITWGLAISFFMFFLGANAARSGMSTPAPTHRLDWAAAVPASAGVEVRLLRSFQDWILVADAERNVAWIRSNHVARVQRLETSLPFQGLLCLLSNDWCLPDIGRRAPQSPPTPEAAAPSPLPGVSAP